MNQPARKPLMPVREALDFLLSAARPVDAVEEVERWVHPAMGRLGRHTDGCVLEGSTSNPALYVREWLARVPVPFRIEGGDALLQEARTVVAQLTAAVTGST